MEIMQCTVSLVPSTYNQVHMRITKYTRAGWVAASPRMLLQMLVLLALGVFDSAQIAVAASNELDSDMARLQRGEILVRTVHEKKSGGAAQVTALFHSSVEAVWNVIGYCKNEFIYVRGLELCELVKPGLSVMRKHHRVNNNWYTPTIDFTFEASRTSSTHGEFQLVGGNLKVMEGMWDFQPHSNSGNLVVTHEIRIRSRFPVPRWLMRRVLKNDLPDMVACVRGLASASGDDERLAADLERCPGDTARANK
jgi:hypothetical protein